MSVTRPPGTFPSAAARSLPAWRRRASRSTLLGATLAGTLTGVMVGAGLGSFAPAFGASIAIDSVRAAPAPRPAALPVAARRAPVAAVLAPARGVDAPSVGEPEERQP